MTLIQARKIFREEIAVNIPKNDTAMLDCAFNDWTDSLFRDGLITERQYNTWCRT